MEGSFIHMLRRDIAQVIRFRNIVIWTLMSLLGIFFFSQTGGIKGLRDNGTFDYMALFLVPIIFGAWAVMTVFYDMISADREDQILDCILCSGISRRKVMISKVLSGLIISVLLSITYILPSMIYSAVKLKSLAGMPLMAVYMGPMFAYITVYMLLGLFISVLSKSSKTALIVNLGAGLIMMPRFFQMFADGIGNALSLSDRITGIIERISPGILVDDLMDPGKTEVFIPGLIAFIMIIVVLSLLSVIVFSRQSESNYGG